MDCTKDGDKEKKSGIELREQIFDYPFEEEKVKGGNLLLIHLERMLGIQFRKVRETTRWLFGDPEPFDVMDIVKIEPGFLDSFLSDFSHNFLVVLKHMNLVKFAGGFLLKMKARTLLQGVEISEQVLKDYEVHTKVGGK